MPDGAHRLWLVPLAGGAPRLVAQDPRAEIQDASFSPDGRWLAFSQQRPNGQRGLYCYELATGRTTALSSPLNNDADPVFSPDGRYLYYRSSRHELPAVSSSESNFATLKADGLYVATLQATALSPFAPGAATAPAHDLETASPPPAIDLAGLLERSVPLPIAPGDLGALVAAEGGVFYQSHPPGLIGGELPGEASALHFFTLASRQDRVVASGFDHGVLSADGQRLLCRQNGGWHLLSTAPDGKGKDTVLSLKDMQTRINPRQEWATMFAAAGRLERDLFFNPTTLAANSWDALRTHYARLLPLLGSREDARYLTGQLLGELGSSHVFVGGGDAEGVPAAPALPLLGVDFELDARSGRYRLAKIYAGDNSRPAYRSPLTEPGLGVRAGDYLLAVNGHALKAPQNPYEVFVGLTGPLTLRVAAMPTGPARDIVVQPLTSETSVREQDWIARTRARVEQLSGGRVGYVYLGDFHRLGAEQFVRQYYPQLDKQALILDVRWNVGGYTSQLILERLRRRPVGAFLNREQAVSALPDQAAPSALVTITNEFSGSDGDQFPYYFQQYGLGKVVGTRTWGGVRGLNGAWRLLDGGFVTVPKDALISTQGQWLLENEGATPDLEVANEPGDYLQDLDRQLVAAWQVLAPGLCPQPVPLPLPASQSAYPPAGEVPPARIR